MRRVLLSALATAAIGFSATPALATAAPVGITECSGGASCVSGTTNVNLNTYPDSGAGTVTGTYATSGGATGGTVYFTSTDGNLTTNTGAATVYLASGSNFTNLTFYLLGTDAFSQAEFNLEMGDPSQFWVTITDSASQTYSALTSGLQGSNIFDVVSAPGTTITSVTISTVSGSPTGSFKDLKQLRLMGGNAAVPEPATWMMMLLGFGGMGMALRRSRRRSQQALMQIA